MSAPTTANIIQIKPTPTVANANITVATICTIRFVLIAAAESAENPNAIGTINKNKAEIIIMSIGNNVIEVLLPFSF